MIGIVTFGCATSGFESGEELHAFTLTSQSELTREVKVNGYSIRVTYRPTDLLVYQELDAAQPDSAEIGRLRAKYGGYYYFALSLSRDSREALVNSGDRGEYNKLLTAMAFQMGEFASLTTSAGDTIPISDYILNRTFGLSPSTDLLFVFNKKSITGEEWVQFDLEEFGLNAGHQRFKFPTTLLDNAPGINFNKIRRGG